MSTLSIVYLVAGIGAAVVSTVGWWVTMTWATGSRRHRHVAKRTPRVVIAYRDAFGTGEWCTFDRALAAYEAAEALNSAYEGKKQFWVDEATVTTGADYLGTVSAPTPAPAPRPHARPKPGTPIVRQLNGRWYVQTGRFEIGYGSGEAGYRAALAAVERFHKS